jgi:preprotein translocase subunit SecD
MTDKAVHDVLDQAIPDLPARLTPPTASMIRQRSQRRRARATIAAAAAAVLAVAGVAASSPVLLGSGGTPAGGDDGIVLTLRATTADGGPPSGDDLNRTATLLSHRLAASGLARTTARVQDGSRIVIAAPATQPTDVLRRLIAPGQFQIRLVLGQTPSPGAGHGAAPATTGPALPKPTLQQVRAKLGGAYDLALQSIEPGTAMKDTPALQPFASLTAAEVAVLPASMQFGVPRIGCDKLPGGSAPPADQPATRCESETKYLLEPAAIRNADVAGAVAKTNAADGRHEVVVSFVNGGQERWTDLTRVAHNRGINPRQIAVLLDGTVLAAPVVEEVVPGDAKIQPTSTAPDASIVATLLNDGPLPAYLTEVPPN